ncbi:hypothetical protein VPH35_016485 [Triticum aestivum]
MVAVTVVVTAGAGFPPPTAKKEKENCTRQANGKKDKQDDAGLLEADMLDPWRAGALQMNRLRDLCAGPTRRDMSLTSASERWW